MSAVVAPIRRGFVFWILTTLSVCAAAAATLVLGVITLVHTVFAYRDLVSLAALLTVFAVSIAMIRRGRRPWRRYGHPAPGSVTLPNLEQWLLAVGTAVFCASVVPTVICSICQIAFLVQGVL